ncbi:hypothetical protein ID866_6769 [Astraeus odoratus]|nr:hypothetical protein ID866_6769 [Astraeus odoratus]
MRLVNFSRDIVLLGFVVSALAQNITNAGAPPNSTKVLILGGGMAGVIAARTLHEQGIDDFIIVDGKVELGGRMINKPFGITGRQAVVEMGPNWIQGTQDGNGTANPVWVLAQKWNLSTVYTFFDYNGPNNYSETFNQAVDKFDLATSIAGERLRNNQVDMDLRSAYNLMGASPQTPQEEACDYYQIDFNNNFTYVPESGGFADVNRMCIDQRGFAYIVQAEAAEFLKSNQLLLNQTVKYIQYSDNGVVGVLQNDDVVFEPELPIWKREAISSMEMGIYSKIFLQFNETFWFSTQTKNEANTPFGRVSITYDTSELQDEVMGVLRAMYPNTTIPDPIDIHIPTWGNNELYRGSYSNWGASFIPAHSDNLRATVDGRLWFAGEATSLKYFGFLQGAYFEGQEVANQIAACVKGAQCTSIPNDGVHIFSFPYD